MRMVGELPYSRMLEDEADLVGLEIAAKGCYDIRWGQMLNTIQWITVVFYLWASLQSKTAIVSESNTLS